MTTSTAISLVNHAVLGKAEENYILTSLPKNNCKLAITILGAKSGNNKERNILLSLGNVANADFSKLNTIPSNISTARGLSNFFFEHDYESLDNKLYCFLPTPRYIANRVTKAGILLFGENNCILTQILECQVLPFSAHLEDKWIKTFLDLSSNKAGVEEFGRSAAHIIRDLDKTFATPIAPHGICAPQSSPTKSEKTSPEYEEIVLHTPSDYEVSVSTSSGGSSPNRTQNGSLSSGLEMIYDEHDSGSGCTGNVEEVYDYIPVQKNSPKQSPEYLPRMSKQEEDVNDIYSKPAIIVRQSSRKDTEDILSLDNFDQTPPPVPVRRQTLNSTYRNIETRRNNIGPAVPSRKDTTHHKRPSSDITLMITEEKPPVPLRTASIAPKTSSTNSEIAPSIPPRTLSMLRSSN